MDVKGLMPWSRSRNLPASRFSGEDNPFLALHREMNRTFDDFLRGVDRHGIGTLLEG
ncbi:hypothetical protein [Roseomonas mucosa]|uniref:hypothetical protein n=1 Tax=Roseomonas mucosa TaxID=207340 RepID=UPI001EF60E22|nr:hypothetical protein [Roseomonas mucosa]MCG7358125.1 hypothetical protein [Roseomonas mucosa]